MGFVISSLGLMSIAKLKYSKSFLELVVIFTSFLWLVNVLFLDAWMALLLYILCKLFLEGGYVEDQASSCCCCKILQATCRFEFVFVWWFDRYESIQLASWLWENSLKSLAIKACAKMERDTFFKWKQIHKNWFR